MNPSLSRLKKLISLASLLALASCKAQSPKLEAQLSTYQSVTQNEQAQTVDLTPKADILFVVDYSTSMTRHQVNLSNNVDKFINEFKKNTLVDFHIGVLPLYDRTHCTKDFIQNGYQVGNCKPFGELEPLKGPDSLPIPGQRYVTKSTVNYLEILKRTLLMGEMPGPAFEEFFSPIMPALTNPQIVSGPNNGFYRQDAFLFIIFISDGDDSDQSGVVNISPLSLEQDLTALKGGDRDKISSVGVLSLSSDKACPKDEGAPNGPKKIEEFIRLTKGKLLSLCSHTFGQELANIGTELSVRVGRQEIKLNAVPDFAPGREFEVYWGGELLPRAVSSDFENGWSYNRVDTIYIGANTQLKDIPGAKLTIKMTPIKVSSAINGKVKMRTTP